MSPKIPLLVLLLLVCAPVPVVAQCDPVFSGPPRYGVPNRARHVVANDFDSDGRVDLATFGTTEVPLGTSGRVGILWNRPEGLVPDEPIALPGPGYVLARGSDKASDPANRMIVIGPFMIASIERVNGVFETTTTPVAGVPLRMYAVTADLNGDGRTDVAAVAGNTTSGSPRYVRRFLGQSNGTFLEVGTASDVWGNIFAIAAGDRDGDDNIDLVLGDSSIGQILYGNGDGFFEPTAMLLTHSVAFSTVSMGDFDGDDRADVLANGNLLLTSVENSTYVGSGKAVDLNDDGFLDIYRSDAVVPGNGDGTFDPPVAHDAYDGIGFADMNGDDALDIVTANIGGVAVHHAQGALQYEPAPQIATRQGRTIDVLAADLNGDSRDDVVHVELTAASSYLSDPAGSPQLVDAMHNLESSAGVLGDFNGDGDLDFIHTGEGIAYGNGDGTFGEFAAFHALPYAEAAATADFNDDGHLDFVAAGDVTFSPAVAFFLNDGSGAFTRTEIAMPAPFGVATGDFDEDGNDDAVIGTWPGETPGELYLVRGTALATLTSIATGAFGGSVDAGDVDGDGRLDLVVLTDPVDELLILDGNGDGTFDPPRRVNVADSREGDATLVDFTGDGRLDVFVTQGSLDEGSLYVQQSDGGFVETLHRPAWWTGSIAGDFNGDDRQDLLLEFTSRLDIALNVCEQELATTVPEVTLQASTNSPGADTTVMLTAHVDPPVNGYVTFYERTKFNDTVWETNQLAIVEAVSGVATLSAGFSAGKHELHAAFWGNGDVVVGRSPMLEVNASGDTSLVAPSELSVKLQSQDIAYLTWHSVANADFYIIERRTASTDFVEIGTEDFYRSFNDLTVLPGTAYLYRVRAATADREVVSQPSPVGYITTFPWSDGSPSDPPKKMKAIHWTELRTAANAVRALAGLTPFAWTDAALTGKPIRHVHVTQIRTALDAARNSLGLEPAAYITDPTLASGVAVKARHLSELRDAMKGHCTTLACR